MTPASYSLWPNRTLAALCLLLSPGVKSLAKAANYFFFDVRAPPMLFPLSLHDALPICPDDGARVAPGDRLSECRLRERLVVYAGVEHHNAQPAFGRSEEHTSELQSRFEIVCRLPLEKRKYGFFR